MEKVTPFNYNSQDVDIILKEYGRNIQRMVGHLKTIEDPEERTEMAHVLIKLMRQLNPNYANAQDYQQKLWDDLYIMAEFDIELDGPFPPPEPEMLNKKPEPVAYSTGEVRYRHYGRNVELLIEEAARMEDAEAQESATIFIGRMMKNYYTIWNKGGVDDAVIVDQLRTLSEGRLHIPLERVRAESLFDGQPIRDNRDNRSELPSSGRKGKRRKRRSN
ncbi:MAG: DUF4290 domain-containing protein [Catalinimonas sp.]